MDELRIASIFEVAFPETSFIQPDAIGVVSISFSDIPIAFTGRGNHRSGGLLPLPGPEMWLFPPAWINPSTSPNVASRRDDRGSPRIGTR